MHEKNLIAIDEERIKKHLSLNFGYTWTSEIRHDQTYRFSFNPNVFFSAQHLSQIELYLKEIGFRVFHWSVYNHKENLEVILIISRIQEQPKKRNALTKKQIRQLIRGVTNAICSD